MKVRSFLLVTLASVAGLLLISPLAIAALKSSGQGHGSALPGTLQPVTVAAIVNGDSPSTQLQPGGTADVILRVRNANTHAVSLVSVVANGTITASGGIGTCTATGVSFTNQTGLAVNIPASSTTLVHLAGAASMSTSSTTGCQGATFSIPVAITANEL